MSEVPLQRTWTRWGSGSAPSPLLLFFFTLVTGPGRSSGLKLSDTRVYEPQIRARLGTTTADVDAVGKRLCAIVECACVSLCMCVSVCVSLCVYVCVCLCLCVCVFDTF